MRINGKLIKRLTALTALCAAVMPLSGCGVISHTELDKLAIAEQIGIDHSADGFTVTLQYFNTDASGGVTAVDSSAPNAVTVPGSGGSVESALDAVSYTAGKNIMLGAAGLIIFGGDSAFDISAALRTMSTHYSGNSHALIAFSDGKAEDVLNVKFIEGNASVEKLELMITNAEDMGLSRRVELYEAEVMLTGATESAVFPLLHAYQGESELTEEGNSVIISGGVVCTDGKKAGELSVTEMSGCSLLTDPAPTCELSLRLNGAEARVMLYSFTREIVPFMKDGRLCFDIQLNAACKLLSSGLAEPFARRGEIQELCEREICRRVTAALDKTVISLGADAFGLEYTIRSRSPELWDMVSGNYRDRLRNSSCSVRAAVNMERFGV